MTFPSNPNNNDTYRRFGRNYVYRSGKGWTPETLDTATTLTQTSINTFSDIDVVTSAPTDGQLLVWDSDGGKFIPGDTGSGTTTYATANLLPLSGNTAGDQAFVTATNRLYIWNGSGWYNIALINTAPSITSGVNASYEFATDGTPIVITAVGSDPEGVPLTWSYSVTSGTLGNTATVSQADNVFTITPSTNALNGGVFDITFTASDGINLATAASTFTLAFARNVEYLVVGGGGAGGRSNGGGGGAGGVLTGTASLISGTYTVTVGNGGAFTTVSSQNGNNGQDSVFSGPGITATAIGGGGGASETSGTQAGSGGSGGGGNGYATTNAILKGSGTAGPPRQGYDGGQSSGRLTGYLAPGGGGAGGPGESPVGSAGNGGVGYQWLDGNYYAGGGGGGTYNVANTGVGGNGGGGNGGSQTPSLAATSGTPNTGGGGGGGGNGQNAGSGGSGVVIIRHPDSEAAATSTTGSPTVTVSGGYRYYTFTASGSITF